YPELIPDQGRVVEQVVRSVQFASGAINQASHLVHSRHSLSPESREMVEQALHELGIRFVAERDEHHRGFLVDRDDVLVHPVRHIVLLEQRPPFIEAVVADVEIPPPSLDRGHRHSSLGQWVNHGLPPPSYRQPTKMNSLTFISTCARST